MGVQLGRFADEVFIVRDTSLKKKRIINYRQIKEELIYVDPPYPRFRKDRFSETGPGGDEEIN